MIIVIVQESFRNLCESNGLAVTHQRQVIWDVLTSMGGHPMAEDVYEKVKEKIPSISLATVYKNIRVFVEHGMLNEVSLHHGSSRLETNRDFHFHAVCIGCRSIRDIPLDAVHMVHCEPGTLSGFKLRRVSVEFQGLCERCAAQSKQR